MADRDYRFRPTRRLNEGSQFGRVFKKNVRSADSCFTILARRSPATGPRLGMAIARKAVRSAVARNRVKRLVRESFRLNRHTLPSADFVVLARPGIAKRDNMAISQALARHWSNLGRKLSTGSKLAPPTGNDTNQ